MQKDKFDQWQDGFNNPDGLHTNAEAQLGAAQRRAAEFKVDLPAAPSGSQYSGGANSIGSTVKAFAWLGAVAAALYGFSTLGTAVAAIVYALMGAAGGAVAGGLLHIAFKVLAFVLRVAVLIAGALLVIWAFASVFSS